MAITFQQAITLETAAQYRAALLLNLAANGSTVSGWSDGAPQRAFLEGEARALAAESLLRVGLASTASIALCIAAGPSWVDAVMSFFDLPDGQGGKGRIKATRAVWQVPMEITPATPAQTINSTNSSAIQVQSTGGIIFVGSQQAEVKINPASVPTPYKGTLQFTARTAGTSGNVDPGQIVKMISGPAGMSVDLGGTQVQTVVARDEENDADFIARGLGKWARLGAGWTTPAWDYYVPFYGNNGTTLNVTRWVVDETNPDGPGTVHVYLANADGPATTDEVDAVDAGLNGRDVKPVGAVDVNVSAAVEHALTINITITTDGSNGNVEAQCEAAIERLIAAFPLGPATLEVDLVSAVARGSPIISATIATGATAKVIALNLPGFSSVIDATVVDVFGGIDLALGEVFTAVVTVTVLP